MESETVALPEVKAVSATTSKPRRKSVVQQPPQLANVPLQAPSAPKGLLPGPAGPVKMAWAKDNDPRPVKPSGIALGLREEAKKLDARKAAEKEREKSLRNSVSASASDEMHSFTTSWGLPTSQAGSNRSTPSKDTQVTTTSPQAALAALRHRRE